jgi:hypothetical protein
MLQNKDCILFLSIRIFLRKEKMLASLLPCWKNKLKAFLKEFFFSKKKDLFALFNQIRAVLFFVLLHSILSKIMS